MTQTQQQIIYKQVKEKDLIAEYQTNLSLYKKYKLDPLDRDCHAWLAASIGCILLPIALASWKQATPPLRALNFVLSGLGLGSAVMAKSSASAYMKADRKYFSNESFLESLEQEDRDAQFGAFQLALQAELDARLPQKPEQRQQSAQAVALHPEWIEERIRIQAEFKEMGLPISVQSKEIAGQKIIYVIRPTPGVPIEKLVQEGTSRRMALRLLVNAGLHNATIKPVAGRILLIVDNPHAPMLMDIKAAEPQYVPAPVGRQEQHQQHDRTHDQPPAQSNTVQPAPPFTQDHQPQPQPPSGVAINFAGHDRVQSKTEQMASAESEVFAKFLKAPHNWICGKTNGGKTFLTLRLLWDWVQSNPGGEVIICDRNFGKPDRVTGEIFDWNGIDDRIIYASDSEIQAVLEDQAAKLTGDLERFADYARRRSRAIRSGEPFDEPAPEKRKVLIVITEWNALADATRTGANLESSPCVSAILPILQQGNGYGIKIILDGQSIAVRLSGISQAARMQTSVCMVGDNCVDTNEVSQLISGQPGKQLIAQCSELKQQGHRACIIQLGEGSPVAAIVPDMPYLRTPQYRFDNFRVESPEIADYDDRFEDKLGFDPDDADRLDGTDPYQAILDWVARIHPDRVNDKAFPDDVTLNFLWCKWFQQNDKTIQPLNHKGLAELRNILNQKRGG